MNKKRIKHLILVVCLIGILNPVYANMFSETNLIINSVPVNTGAKPIIKNGRTLAPIRVISESLGASVKWDQKTKKIEIKKDADFIEMTLNKPQVKVNGKTQILEQPPVLHNNSTMLPLRFIGEALGCDVQWDSKTRTVTVTSKGGVDVEKPNFSKDKWGRNIRTTNLPKNAQIFQYIVDGVPNWVYEQINMTNNALISESGVKANPKELWGQTKGNASVDYDKMMNLLNEYFDIILNIDYRTFDEDKFIEFAVDNYHPNSYPKDWGVSSIEGAARVYAKYIKDNKMIVKGEFQVLPEMFWENNLDTHVVSAHVKLTVVQQGPKGKGGFESFGTVTGGKKPHLTTGKTYEGLVQFRVSDYKIDYNTNSVTSQISLDNNIYGGAKKTNNPY